MIRHTVIWLLCIITLCFAISCSNGEGDVTGPATDTRVPVSVGDSHMLWGLWQFTADPVNQKLDATQIRTGSMHLNALNFLEPPALVYLSLESLEFNGDIIDVDIGIRHPFLGLTEFTGFDVSGVLITNGSYDGFDDSDICYAGPGDTYLMNPDGHSRWWNPEEFPKGAGMLGYKDGMLGAPDSFADYNSTINGYKYFCDDLSDPDDPLSEVTPEDRGMFSAGQQCIRHFAIQLGAEGLVFNYAVDACWQFPSGAPPFTAPDDFAPGANRAEPWWIDITETSNSLYYYDGAPGGSISLDVDVYDRYNIGDVQVYIEAANGVVPKIGPIAADGGGDGYSTYEIDILDAELTEAGSIDLLITVECEEENFQGFISGTNTSAYRIHRAFVDDAPVVTHTVTGIFPAHGTPDVSLEDVEVYGADFSDGAPLAVRLEMSGEPDIVATNVVFQGDDTITCDLNIPASAAVGLWDVVVVNGDGTEAKGDELFDIFDCGTMTPCTTGGSITTSPPGTMFGEWCGVTCTREGTSYLIATGPIHNTFAAIDATATGGSSEYQADAGGNLTSDLACTSDNTIFFVTESNYSQLHQIPFDPDTGFGKYSLFGSITDRWEIQRICVDDEDNPIVLAFEFGTYDSIKVFHWNGTGWDETDVPKAVFGPGSKYISDFDYNHVLDHYVFTCIGADYPNYPCLHAIDRDGNHIHTEKDIFNWNHDLWWWPGIYIDQDDPDCHIFTWGGDTYSTANSMPRPSARYDAFYGNKASGDMPTLFGRGPGGPRGAWAPGTNRLFTQSMGGNVISWFTLPGDW